MAINEQTLKGKWLEIKGEVRKAWGKLTDDELEKTKGDLTSITGLIQQKYGADKEKHESMLSKIVDRFTDKKDEVLENTKQSLRDIKQ